MSVMRMHPLIMQLLTKLLILQKMTVTHHEHGETSRHFGELTRTFSPQG